VARPAGGNDFTIVGESEVQTTSANQLNTFPTQISVEAGDLIGEVRVGSGDCGRNEPGYFTQFLGQRSASGKQEHLWHPIQLPAGPVGHPRARLRWRRVGRRDSGPTGAARSTLPDQARTLTLDANKNKVKKGKKVTLTGRLTELARQGECQATQTVELQRKKPSQSTFTTIEQLQTDSAGSFSAKEKVKKTFEYRAQVPETATCGEALSNTEKVKVKMKK
jgi:hypothetical protein